MVHVVLRFQVALGLKDSVANAFRARPQQAEHAPGFMGMEVFTDNLDQSLFYLATRWIDSEAFHQWHSKKEYRLSHIGIPKGLILDATFTKLSELTHLQQPEESLQPDALLSDVTFLFQSFLAKTEGVIFLATDREGYFLTYNDFTLRLLKTTPQELKTSTVWKFLTSPDVRRLRSLLESKNTASSERIRLNLVDSSQLPHTLDCDIQCCANGGFLIIGELPHDKTESSFEKLLQLHNETTVIVREQHKQEKRLQKAKTELDLLVAERTKELVQYQSRLRAMAMQMTLLEERERHKIAQDLHDQLAQLLAVSKISLTQIARSKNLSEVKQLTETVDDLLDQSLNFTRNLVADLHPAVLFQLGLLAALVWLADNMRHYGLEVQTPEVTKEIDLSDDHKLLIYRTVRELLFNILKHAEVKKATVRWSRPSGKTLKIIVRDQGKGFDASSTLSAQEPGHLGLLSIKERMEQLNGQFHIESVPQKGTKVTIQIPLSVGLTKK